MPNVELFLRGDQIATYQSLSMSGNGNGVKLTLNGAETLGSAEDVFRIVVRQVSDGQDAFSNGQFVDIYAWPDTSDPPEPIFSSLNPQHDQFQGRASSSEHQIITSPEKVFFDINGITNGTVHYGPGLYPLRADQLHFDALDSEPPVVPCFTAGTLVETPGGPRLVETLRPGDLVRTYGNGAQPLVWVGGRRVGAVARFAPVRFDARLTGTGAPLVVSPQHRMLMRGAQAEMLFGQREVLVAAKHLTGLPGVSRISGGMVHYVHMMFARHEIVHAGGVLSESFHPGQMAISSLDMVARSEITALFPTLAAFTSSSEMHTARHCLRAWEAQVLGALMVSAGQSILARSPAANRARTAA